MKYLTRNLTNVTVILLFFNLANFKKAVPFLNKTFLRRLLCSNKPLKYLKLHCIKIRSIVKFLDKKYFFRGVFYVRGNKQNSCSLLCGPILVRSTQAIVWEVLITLAGVYFNGSIRTDPSTEKMDTYYRLMKSYRHEDGRVCHRTFFNMGFTGESLRGCSMPPKHILMHATAAKTHFLQKQTDRSLLWQRSYGSDWWWKSPLMLQCKKQKGWSTQIGFNTAMCGKWA